MKIYTKKGDSGETSLFGGERVLKQHIRIDTYGTVDELNSVLGVALAHPCSDNTRGWLNEIQKQLFVLGADLATPPEKQARIERITEADTDYLEKAIDEMEESLPALKTFILPGGSLCGAQLHLARTICRRAERLAVECTRSEDITPEVLKYLNRLSDFLFTLARYENKVGGAEERPWIPD
jgi:cob(I)alamin adenosyltransferase